MTEARRLALLEFHNTEWLPLRSIRADAAADLVKAGMLETVAHKYKHYWRLTPAGLAAARAIKEEMKDG